MNRFSLRLLLLVAFLSLTTIGYGYLKNERLNYQASLKFKSMCSKFPTVENKSAYNWDKLKRHSENLKNNTIYITFDDKIEQYLTPRHSYFNGRLFQRKIPVFVNGALKVNIFDIVLLKKSYFPSFLKSSYIATSCFSEKNNQYASFLYSNSFK